MLMVCRPARFAGCCKEEDTCAAWSYIQESPPSTTQLLHCLQHAAAYDFGRWLGVVGELAAFRSLPSATPVETCTNIPSTMALLSKSQLTQTPQLQRRSVLVAPRPVVGLHHAAPLRTKCISCAKSRRQEPADELDFPEGTIPIPIVNM